MIGETEFKRTLVAMNKMKGRGVDPLKYLRDEGIDAEAMGEEVHRHIKVVVERANEGTPAHENLAAFGITLLLLGWELHKQYGDQEI